MVNRRGAVALATAVAVLGSVSVFAQKDKKQDEAQKKEVQAVVKLVDGAMAGQPMPNDLGLAWAHQDFLKAQGNKEYVPFIVTLDPSKVAAGHVAFYWRVVATGAPAADAAADKDKKKDKDKKGKWPYEDVSFVPATAGQSGPMQIDRSFTVPGGTYDVYLVAQEMPAAEKNAPPPEDLDHQAAGHGAGFLERRAQHELGHHRREDQPAGGAADARAAGRSALRDGPDGDRAGARR